MPAAHERLTRAVAELLDKHNKHLTGGNFEDTDRDKQVRTRVAREGALLTPSLCTGNRDSHGGRHKGSAPRACGGGARC